MTTHPYFIALKLLRESVATCLLALSTKMAAFCAVFKGVAQPAYGFLSRRLLSSWPLRVRQGYAGSDCRRILQPDITVLFPLVWTQGRFQSMRKRMTSA